MYTWSCILVFLCFFLMVAHHHTNNATDWSKVNKQTNQQTNTYDINAIHSLYVFSQINTSVIICLMSDFFWEGKRVGSSISKIYICWMCILIYFPSLRLIFVFIRWKSVIALYYYISCYCKIDKTNTNTPSGGIAGFKNKLILHENLKIVKWNFDEVFHNYIYHLTA